jgi:hypothetical protein
VRVRTRAALSTPIWEAFRSAVGLHRRVAFGAARGAERHKKAAG